MRRLRKLCALMTCLCLAAMLAGCRGPANEGATEEISVYATFYPIYAVASMITEDVPDLYLNCLVQPQDGCLRNYALSDWDVALLSSADAVLAGGQGLESFGPTLQLLGEEQMAVTELLYNMELDELTAENTESDGDSHWLDANPHIYMSIKGATEIAGRAAQSMTILDPRYADLYLNNLEKTEERLAALLDEVRAETAGCAGKKVAVLNEALIYAAQNYGLDIALCWDRDSGESMDVATLDALLAALDERGIRVALIEKQAPQGLVEALKGAGIAVAAMDVLSTRRADEGYEGYFAAQRANAAAIREAYLSIPEEHE